MQVMESSRYDARNSAKWQAESCTTMFSFQADKLCLTNFLKLQFDKKSFHFHGTGVNCDATFSHEWSHMYGTGLQE